MSNDVELTYEIFSKKYPEYKMECIDAYIRNVLYYRGVLLLKCGEKTEARSHFLKTIIRKPLYFKAWIRLLHSFLIKL